MLLQAFLKFQHPKNPQEILLDVRDPQSDMKRLFQTMLQDFSSWQLLLDESLERILQQYLSAWGQQPGWGDQQGNMLQPRPPTVQYQQQPHGQRAGWRAQQGTHCSPSPMVQGQQPGRGEQQGQVLQACPPTGWQLSSEGQQSRKAATPSPLSQGSAQGER